MWLIVAILIPRAYQIVLIFTATFIRLWVEYLGV